MTVQQSAAAKLAEVVSEAGGETDRFDTARRFVDQMTLRALVAPLAEAEFRAHYWEQKPIVVHRSAPDYFGDLFTLQDFDESLTRAPAYVKTAEATTKKQTIHQGVSASALERVLADMRDGATLILDGVQHRDPKLGLLCRLLAQEVGHGFQTNLYLTPPNGKGFLPHWDNHDVFVLQILGSKHWKLEKERRAFPSKEENIADEGRELRGAVDSFTLEQGDMVYIPRGFVHAAECGSECSLHITLGVHAFTWEELLHAAIKAAARRDEGLLHALPLGYMQAGRDALVQRATAALSRTADPVFLAEVVDQFKDEMVKSFPLDVSGQVLNFYQPTPLTLGDVVGVRQGVIYQIHVSDDSVRLNFGTRSIVFPSFFLEALNFALNNPAFAIRELPGDLQDEERIVFVERLMQEVLLIRQ